MSPALLTCPLVPPHPATDVSHVFPEFPAPDLGSVLLQENITLHDIKALQLAYRRHCEVTAPRTPSPGPGGSGGRLGQLRGASARASLGVPAGDKEQTGLAPPPSGRGWLESSFVHSHPLSWSVWVWKGPAAAGIPAACLAQSDGSHVV